MNKTLQRGFTLIELLVVIAIIGILAAVVIGSLNDARSGGQNASIQQTMTSLRSQAELYYNRPTAATPPGGNFTYRQSGTNFLCTDPAVEDALTAALTVVNAPAYNPADTYRLTAAANSLADATARKAQCVNNSSQYRIVVPLAQNEGYWCIDSDGNALATTTPTGASPFAAVTASNEPTATVVMCR